MTAERLDSLIYSPSPTTPAPSAAFTPSPLPTPEPTNGDLWTWQSRVYGRIESPRHRDGEAPLSDLEDEQPDTDKGFCDVQISSMWNMMNFYLCYCANYNNLNWREDATRVGCDEGDPAFSASKSLNRLIYPGGATTNIGFRAFAGFTVPANMSGTWRFQIYYDQSRGGFWCFDANCTWAQGMGDDLWEGELAEGYHSFEWIGYDKCCHSLGAVLAQPPGWDYYGNFSLAMLGAASPSPTVSPTTSVVPTVSAPPTRADDCYAQPDNFAYCDAYLGRVSHADEPARRSV